ATTVSLTAAPPQRRPRSGPGRSSQGLDLVHELARQPALPRLVELLAQDLLRGVDREVDHLLLDVLLRLLVLARDVVLGALQAVPRILLRLMPDLGRHLLALRHRL